NSVLSLNSNDVANVLVSVPAGSNMVYSYTPTSGGSGASLTIDSSNSLPLAANVLITDQYNDASYDTLPTNGTMIFAKLALLDVSSDLTAGDVTYYLTVGYTCGTIVAPYSYNSATSSWTPLTITNSITTNPCSITFPIPADPVIGVFTETHPASSGPRTPATTGGPAVGAPGGSTLPTLSPYSSGNQTGYTITDFSQSN